MVKIDFFVFGYRKVRVPLESLSLASDLLVRGKIGAEMFSGGIFYIRERDVNSFKKLFGNRVEYDISDTLGVWGVFKAIKHKKTVFISSLFVTLLILLLSNLVWDIRVSGNEKLSDAEIVYELAENGFSVGKLWQSCNRSIIETNMLLSVKELGWININRRGSIAYVEVLENEIRSEEEFQPTKYSNIVASCDCVIEEVTVFSGIAAVKPGDVVKKGDLLITGVMAGDGKIGRASGSVIGRMSDQVYAFSERNYEEKRFRTKSLYSFDLKIFNFSINILKTYGNLTEECDIIEDVKEYSLFGVKKIPLGTVRKYIRLYETVSQSYTDNELVNITLKKHSSLLHSRLALADLQKIKTYGRFTDSGYEMYSDIVFCAEVGCEKEFSVE